MVKKNSPRVKPQSRQDHPKFKRIKDLQCFEGLRHRIVAGWTLGQLVNFVQIDNRELTDVSSDVLYRLIREYKESMPPGEVLTSRDPEQLTQRMNKAASKAIEEVYEGLDELKELRRLYDLQMERIHLDKTLEDKNGKCIPTVTPDMKLAKEILESSAQLKMDLGLSKRHLGLIEADNRTPTAIGAAYGSEAVSNVLSNAESRQRVANVAQRFLLTDGKITESVLEQFLASKRQKAQAEEPQNLEASDDC